MKSPSIDQKSLRASPSSFVSRRLRIPLKVSCGSFTLYKLVRADFRTPRFLPDNCAVPSAIEKMKCSPLCGVIISFTLILRARITDASNIFQLLNVCYQNVSLPENPSHNTYPRKIPGRTFLPNWWSLDWSFAERG